MHHNAVRRAISKDSPRPICPVRIAAFAPQSPSSPVAKTTPSSRSPIKSGAPKTLKRPPQGQEQAPTAPANGALSCPNTAHVDSEGGESPQPHLLPRTSAPQSAPDADEADGDCVCVEDKQPAALGNSEAQESMQRRLVAEAVELLSKGTCDDAVESLQTLSQTAAGLGASPVLEPSAVFESGPWQGPGPVAEVCRRRVWVWGGDIWFLRTLPPPPPCPPGLGA